MGIGERIKTMREYHGLSQVELANLIGVSSSAIGNYETGVRHPKEGALCKLMEVLGVDANYFYSGMVKHVSYDVTPLEYDMIQKYRVVARLSPKGKRNVDCILENEYEFCTSENLN